MKKNALVIAGLALLSTSAFASKARMEALGTNAGKYVSDKGRVFTNPAAINTHKNYIVTEWGNAQGTDSDTSPRAEGGFFREVGSLSYGLYFGNNGGRNTGKGAVGADLTVAANQKFLSQDNALDLFIGGDAGLQWGARLHYANSKDERTTAAEKRENSALGVGVGIVMGDMDVYANVDISDKSKGNGVDASFESKLKPSFTVGASYAWSGFTFFAEVESDKTEEKTATTTTTKNFNIVAGAGRVMEINPTARVIGSMAIALNKEEVGSVETKETLLPVSFGFEADATSWLTLRGSVGQNVVLGETKTGSQKQTTSSTFVHGGATLNFGKLAIDGVIGKEAAGTKSGKLHTDELLSRVGVTYNF